MSQKKFITQEELMHLPQKPRKDNSYFVSLILNSHFRQEVLLDYQQDLLSQLNFSKMLWDYPDLVADKTRLILKIKEQMIFQENFWNKQLADKDDLDDFENLKKHLHFQSIVEIEQQISAKLGKIFNFNVLTSNVSAKAKKKIETSILDLYNFIVSSKILTKNELLGLLYAITPIDESRSPSAGGATSCAMAQNNISFSAMIGIEIRAEFLIANRARENYKNGWYSSNHWNHVFIHEFAHALAFYYCLPPNFKAILNQNIFDRNQDESMIKKMKDHFENNYPRRFRTLENFLPKKAADFMFDTVLDDVQHRYSNAMNLLIKWILVPSGYGRQKVVETNQIPGPSIDNAYNEWFAEGFAYYFLTPREFCDEAWNLWHGFFVTKMNIYK